MPENFSDYMSRERERFNGERDQLLAQRSEIEIRSSPRKKHPDTHSFHPGDHPDCVMIAKDAINRTCYTGANLCQAVESGVERSIGLSSVITG